MEVLFDPLKERSPHPLIVQNEGEAQEGLTVAGPESLLGYLTPFYGLEATTKPHSVRVEQYRRALKERLDERIFYRGSFEADEVAVAKTLLAWRDELKWAEWDFRADANTPHRLKVLSELEQRAELDEGSADRWVRLKERIIGERVMPFTKIHCTLPKAYTPPFFRRLLEGLEEKRISVGFAPLEREPIAKQGSDLERLQDLLAKRERGADPDRVRFQGDGSLILLDGASEDELARFFARVLKDDPNYRPFLLRGAKDEEVLSRAMQEVGLPLSGETEDTAKGPAPQLFFLATQLVWKPLDHERLLEFLTLPLNPLPPGLCEGLAELLEEKPGLGSEEWNERIEQYKKKIEDDKQRERFEKRIAQWLHHPLHDENEGIPAQDLKERFEALREWAIQGMNDPQDEGREGYSVLVAFIDEFLETLAQSDEEMLGRSLVEKWTEEVYGEAIREKRSRQAYAVGRLHGDEELGDPPERTLWWNFASGPDEGGGRRDWTKNAEKAYLEEMGIEKETPVQRMQQREWVAKGAFFSAKEQLVLARPFKVDGADMAAHALQGDLESACEELLPIHFDPGNPELEKLLAAPVPELQEYETHSLPETPAYWEIERGDLIREREHGSYSSLNDLFFYPYRWVLEHQARLKKGKVHRPPEMKQLLGSLGHRLAEKLFTTQRLEELDAESIRQWVNAHLDELLEQEGSPLLMKGKQSQKEQFRSKIVNALVTLADSLRKDGWKVKGMERSLRGDLAWIKIRGYIDMLLERDDGKKGLLDLKWGGSWVVKALREEEDLQLALYAACLSEKDAVVPSGYFLLQQAQLYSRYQDEFSDSAFPEGPIDEDGRDIQWVLIERMRKTYAYRIEELKNGRIEVGDGLPLGDLDAASEMDGEELLELPKGPRKTKKEAPFNEDYVNLLHVR